MRQFAILHPNGRFNFFRPTAEETKAALVASKSFGETWPSLRAVGYRCVQTDIKVLRDCSNEN